ncbi:MAG: N-acetylglucosamine-6-phosphate deacetylase, partial [Pyrinomonadaceae bacterium]
MLQTHFHSASVVLPNGLVTDSSIQVSSGRIATVGSATGFGPGESFDCTGLVLIPGFIDVHIHGAMGIDVNTADADGLFEIAKFLATKGVTSWVPTLVPDSDENHKRIILAIDRLMEIQAGRPVAQAVGVHYEGVFANEKMCGALRPEYFKKFPTNQLSELPKLNRGIHMTTFAPEVEGGVGLVSELKRQGWIASIGHTKADVKTLDEAFAAGARHVTHFFNAMTGLHHRGIGVAGWALANRDVTFDIIADGIHVHPKMLELACRTKTPGRVSLISDSVAPAGLGDGKFEIWDETVTVENGRTQNERGNIAGSVITILDAVNRMLSLEFTMAEVSQMASLNPAKL